MKRTDKKQINRRIFIGASAASLAAGALPSYALDVENSLDGENNNSATRHNLSGFQMRKWEDYFTTTHNGMILADIESRALHFWSEDLTIYKVYPVSVPLSEDLTKRGRTQIIQKAKNPAWRPTPAMIERNPEWPRVVKGGDPTNPMGSHALYLSWTYYRIHGTHDTRKIGRRSSNGCVGLYNEQIAELYELAKVGTQVLLI